MAQTPKTSPAEALKLLEQAFSYYVPAQPAPVKEAEYYEYLQAA